MAHSNSLSSIRLLRSSTLLLLQKKKEEVLRRPVSTRMAAYGTIRNMLSGLNDPYTRFITPLEVSPYPDNLEQLCLCHVI